MQPRFSRDFGEPVLRETGKLSWLSFYEITAALQAATSAVGGAR
jgi:hypothetical protein